MDLCGEKDKEYIKYYYESQNIPTVPTDVTSFQQIKQCNSVDRHPLFIRQRYSNLNQNIFPEFFSVSPLQCKLSNSESKKNEVFTSMTNNIAKLTQLHTEISVLEFKRKENADNTVIPSPDSLLIETPPPPSNQEDLRVNIDNNLYDKNMSSITNSNSSNNNIVYNTYEDSRIPSIPIGNKSSNIPNYKKNNKSICFVSASTNNSKNINNNLNNCTNINHVGHPNLPSNSNHSFDINSADNQGITKGSNNTHSNGSSNHLIYANNLNRNNLQIKEISSSSNSAHSNPNCAKKLKTTPSKKICRDRMSHNLNIRSHITNQNFHNLTGKNLSPIKSKERSRSNLAVENNKITNPHSNLTNHRTSHSKIKVNQISKEPSTVTISTGSSKSKISSKPLHKSRNSRKNDIDKKKRSDFSDNKIVITIIDNIIDNCNLLKSLYLDYNFSYFSEKKKDTIIAMINKLSTQLHDITSK